MSRLFFLPLVGLLLMAAFSSVAAPGDTSYTQTNADGQQLLQAGVEAFEQGELERARSLLERARDSGMDSFALHYNLGVLYYRTGNYRQSRQAFRQLLESRHEDLAGYNLGLVARAEGDERAAMTWFRRVFDNAEQEKLKRLAGRQLQRLAESRPPASQWLGLASLSGGHESNLALRPDSVASDLSDGFTDILVAGEGPVLALAGSTDSTDEIQLSASIFRRHYLTESDFSSDAAQVGVSWVSRQAAQRYEVGLERRYFRVGGDSWELHTSLLLDYQRDSCAADRLDGRCRLSLTASHVRPFEGFEAYEGMRYQARAGYLHRWSRWRASGYLGLEFNHREDMTEGDQFASLSPRRQELGLELTYTGWANWAVGGGLGYRYSDYPDPYRIASGADWESGRRADHRYTAELTAERALSRAWTVTAAARFHSNDSSLKQYRYHNQVYRIGVDYLF